MKLAILAILAVLPVAAFAQSVSTVATGDTRTVTEPTYPTVCATISATKYAHLTNTINMDPFNSTCGSTGGTNGTNGCTGGTDYQPSSTDPAHTFSNSETLDNTALNSLLSSCAAGQAVEIVRGSSGQDSLVLKPFSLKNGSGSGVRLLLDAGIHIFASRNLSDYGGTNCGIVTSGTSGCNHWITAANTTNAGIYGLGTLDGRGWACYVGSCSFGSAQSFYSNRVQAYCNIGPPSWGSGTHFGSPNCTVNGSGTNSYGPNAMELITANSFTLYKVHLKDYANFAINWRTNSNGFTAWDTWLMAPHEISNTDGWDPIESTNGTFTQGGISTGDNPIAIKSKAYAASNITFSNSQTGGGVGMGVGYDMQHTITNVLFTDWQANGNLNAIGHDVGLKIYSTGGQGTATLDKMTVRNVCMKNEYTSIDLNVDANAFHNILLQNWSILGSDQSGFTSGQTGRYAFSGASATNNITTQLDNVQLAANGQGTISSTAYTAAYLGPGAVSSYLTGSGIMTGTGVTTANHIGTSTPFCTSSSWHQLVGELNINSTSSNFNQTYAYAAPFVLEATLTPTTAINSREQPTLAANVNFYDNCTSGPALGCLIGTVALGGDGTYAPLTISSPTSGTHHYFAYYPGDTFYSPFQFGSVMVTNGTPTTIVPGSMSGNATMSGNAILQ